MGSTVIRNAIVFTVDSNNTIYADGVVVLQDDRIVAVGTAEEITIPEDTIQTIDCQGKVAVIPGLIDVHSHSSLLRG